MSVYVKFTCNILFMCSGIAVSMVMKFADNIVKVRCKLWFNSCRNLPISIYLHMTVTIFSFDIFQWAPV